jgi:Rrf2 family transcriptional regulator, iron-sulfur cluster assembly transcription factor
MFSKTCEYGIRACIYIAEQYLLENKLSQKDIAKAIDSPVAFTAKILQALSKNKIIHSEKGPTGGFTLTKKQFESITLSNIVSAIDGDNIYKGCGLGLKRCNEKKPCPVHNQFKLIRENLKIMLETTTIKELALGLKSGNTFLKR